MAEPIAYHAPCSLQHGLKQKGIVEAVLRDAGYTLTVVAGCARLLRFCRNLLDPAGRAFRALLTNKVKALESGKPAAICTSNIGCLLHIETGAAKPVFALDRAPRRRLAEAAGLT